MSTLLEDTGHAPKQVGTDLDFRGIDVDNLCWLFQANAHWRIKRFFRLAFANAAVASCCVGDAGVAARSSSVSRRGNKEGFVR